MLAAVSLSLVVALFHFELMDFEPFYYYSITQNPARERETGVYLHEEYLLLPVYIHTCIRGTCVYVYKCVCVCVCVGWLDGGDIFFSFFPFLACFCG